MSASAVTGSVAPVLELDGVVRRYGDVAALDGVSLQVEAGELLAIVGPSGCGKTTLLQAVAGLTAIDGGRVTIGGRVVAGGRTWVPPERRRVGVVFQEHALFPHLTVADNVGFGLPTGRERAGRQQEVLDLVRLGHLAARYPHELSGGEQQRVALARALAPQPAVVLLDEPFSSLDATLRAGLRRQTAAVLREAGTTAVFVTHDRTEALAIGDRVAVLRAGRVEQCATPATVFHAPATRFVGAFLGEADLVAGAAGAGVAATALGSVPVPDDASGAVEVMVRPHEVTMAPDAVGAAVVAELEFRGAYVLHRLALDDGTVVHCEVPHVQQVAVGTRVSVGVQAGHPLATFADAGPADAGLRSKYLT